jgi:glycyl-tRNA synthetase
MEKNDKKAKVAKKDKAFDRVKFDELLRRRFFIAQSFEIYKGVKGLYDYGPPGSAVKTNVLNLWRQFFILEDSIFEIECSALTPEPVLVASGHVEKFTDLMVRDEKTGDCFRADHLVKEHIDKLLEKKDIKPADKEKLERERITVDTLNAVDLGAMIKAYKIKSPDTGNPVGDPFAFNLMFSTQIGPTGKLPGFLRPETAQGMFVNFKRLLEYNAGKLPFAAAQIGPAFRNEIAPRSGLLRVREFTLAEIEHFVLPDQKAHPKFSSVADTVIRFFPRDLQLDNKEPVPGTIGDMVAKGVVNNETLGYFIARVHLFLIKIGIDPARLRFRQHLSTEMAHYACDCWDAEIETSYGWIECVGIADRSAYDLTVHTKHSGEPLVAFVEFPDGPKTIEIIEMEADKKTIGATFKKDAKPLLTYLEGIQDNQEELAKLLAKFESEPEPVIEGLKVTKAMVKVQKVQKKITGQNITPSVIEPAFGVGRIIYCLLEHSYYVREGDEQRAVLAIKPIVAPTKCSILPLSQNAQFTPTVQKLTKLLTSRGVSIRVDESSTNIGRRYARTDEIGIPFGVTIDFDTLKDNTVTLRERDSTNQIRISIEELPELLVQLINDNISWDEVYAKYPHQDQPQE